MTIFGSLSMDIITVEQVRNWFASMNDRFGIANRAMLVLSTMVRMAELWSYRRQSGGHGGLLPPC